jgi:predicted kinase
VTEPDEPRLPAGGLLVLVGAAGAGKSTWAARVAPTNHTVSSDALRAAVGLHERDVRASKDAFELLDHMVDVRLRRGLGVIVDTTGLEAPRRAAWLAMARKRGRPAHVVVLDPPAAEVRRRNKARSNPVPSKVLTGQLAALPDAMDALADEGWDAVHHLTGDEPVRVVPQRFLHAPDLARHQREDPMSLTFALHLGRWAWPGGAPALADNIRRVGRTAEEAGFAAISVMDHMMQIPGVGPEWEDIPESTTVLGFLAAATERVQLGALVNGVTYRNLAHLGKQIATLDVLSGGRAFCGLGAAWHEREHELYDWSWPPVAGRYDLLEDALELLPLLWGPGAPRFEGRTTTVSEAICYPRPLQEHVPIIVGGSGERRTLRLVARHADACNLFGEPDVVARKVAVLHEHCAAEGRDPAEILVTHLSTAGVEGPGVERDPAWDDVGTVEEQVGRYRALAEAGVQRAFVGVIDDGSMSGYERFAEVIAAFA